MAANKISFYREESNLSRVTLEGSWYASSQPHELRIVCDDLVPGRLSRIYRYYRIVFGEISFMITQYTGANFGLFVFNRPVSDLRGWWTSGGNSESLLYANIGTYVAGTVSFDYRVLFRTRDLNSTSNMTFSTYFSTLTASTIAYRTKFVIELSNVPFENIVGTQSSTGNSNSGVNPGNDQFGGMSAFSLTSPRPPLQIENNPSTDDPLVEEYDEDLVF